MPSTWGLESVHPYVQGLKGLIPAAHHLPLLQDAARPWRGRPLRPVR